MTSPTKLLAVAGFGLAVTLAGCTPVPPDAEPTPTFSSEAEAFAAAEATYREYVKALNTRRDDPSAPDPQVFLVDGALAIDIETQQQLDQSGLAVVGPTQLVSVDGESVSEDHVTVVISVCLDSSETRVLDIDGVDVTPPDRDTRLLLDVQLTRLGSRLRIASSELVEGATC